MSDLARDIFAEDTCGEERDDLGDEDDFAYPINEDKQRSAHSQNQHLW